MIGAPLLRRLGMVAGLAGAAGAGAVRYLVRRPLPRVSGELRLAGLEAPVEVVRDRWGIPHIAAAESADAWFALGFCHGQDRLWQMELNRRLSRGQLSELLGPVGLELDRLIRRIGLHRAARTEWDGLAAEHRNTLLAYAAGVNVLIDQATTTGRLPIEFRLLRAEPRAWEPLDSLSFARFMAFTQSPNWETELTRATLIARLGEETAATLEPDVWQAGDPGLPDRDAWDLPVLTPRGRGASPVAIRPGPAGSNAWVVSGARSSTGKPLLANDPHIAPRIPSVFYEAQIVAGSDLNVIGATLPGAPGVIIGHNRHIAWGITSGMADVQDLFVERLNPDDPSQTQFGDSWETGQLIREEITVKGRSQPQVEEVLITPRHGPVIAPTPLLPGQDRPLALKSMVLEAPETVAPMMALNRAESWDEFQTAMEGWTTPVLNFAYADVEGNIGYQMAGWVPVRGRADGLVPSPGWDGAYDWTGRVPFDGMPRAFNPPDGLWTTANHNSAKNSAYFFTREFVDRARYDRIRQVLESKERHSAIDFGVLQADEVSLPAREVRAILSAGLHPRTSLERAALDELQGWDGRIGADSSAAAIYQVFRNELIRACFGERVGDLFDVLLGVGLHPVVGSVTTFYFLQTGRVVRLLREWQAAEGEERRRLDAAVQAAFSATVEYLRERLGSDPSRWEWGALHKLTFEHALSIQKPLGLLFNGPTVGLGGDLETVHPAGYLPGTLDAGGVASAYRLIADCGDWDASLSSIPGGQSGHRASPHYLDQVDPWLRTAFHPLPYSRPAVLRNAEDTLRIEPLRD